MPANHGRALKKRENSFESHIHAQRDWRGAVCDRRSADHRTGRRPLGHPARAGAGRRRGARQSWDIGDTDQSADLRRPSGHHPDGRFADGVPGVRPGEGGSFEIEVTAAAPLDGRRRPTRSIASPSLEEGRRGGQQRQFRGAIGRGQASWVEMIRRRRRTRGDDDDPRDAERRLSLTIDGQRRGEPLGVLDAVSTITRLAGPGGPRKGTSCSSRSTPPARRAASPSRSDRSSASDVRPRAPRAKPAS